MSSRERNRDLVRRFVAAGNARDHGALREIVTPDFVRHCPATPDVTVTSADDLIRFLEADAATFPDNKVTLTELVADGDRVAFWGTYSGTQHGPMGPYAPSGNRIACEFAGIFRIEADRIAEVRLTWDNLGVLGQLGHLSLPT
jgi:predicted ester cyclase